MTNRIVPLPPEVEAEARALWAAGRVSLNAIAALIGTSRPGLKRRAAAWNWPPRAGARPSGLGGRRALDDSDRAALAATMERVVARRVSALAADPEADAEHTAREIAHHTRSLSTLRAYRATLDLPPGDPSDEAPARSLGELRDELQRHLERIRDEERAGALRRGADPE